MQSVTHSVWTHQHGCTEDEKTIQSVTHSVWTHQHGCMEDEKRMLGLLAFVTLGGVEFLDMHQKMSNE